MRVLLAGLLALGVAGRATAGNVFLVQNPDGTLKIVNIPGPSLAFRLPSGGASRSLLYPMVEAMAKAHGLDPALVDLVVRLESGYNPKAVSPKGAKGVMQLMPQTAALYGVRNIFDVEENLRGGIRYLRDLLERFDFDLAKALAAYNAGPGAVEKHGGVPPYQETQRYVSGILAAYRGDSQPALSGGFGRPARQGKPARPVRLEQGQGGPLVTNLRAAGEAPIARRLSLR
jgi:hypothetical protein